MLLMRRHGLQYYLDGRQFEWTFSFICLLLGVSMFVWPKTAHGSIMRVLVELVGWPIIAAVFFIVGFTSMIALVANGQSLAIGPRVRAVSAIARSTLWMQFTLSMTIVSIDQGFPSPMLFVWPVVAASEFYVVYRAVLDVRDI
jgi:hypothetical protein